MPPIPENHHMAFDRLVLRARQLFGSAAGEELISPDNVRLPGFRVGKLSMIGEKWTAIEIDSRCAVVGNRRWELEWDCDKAIEVLEWLHPPLGLGPGGDDARAERRQRPAFISDRRPATMTNPHRSTRLNSPGPTTTTTATIAQANAIAPSPS